MLSKEHRRSMRIPARFEEGSVESLVRIGVHSHDKLVYVATTSNDRCGRCVRHHRGQACDVDNPRDRLEGGHGSVQTQGEVLRLEAIQRPEADADADPLAERSSCRAVALVSSMFYVYRLAYSLATPIDRAQRSRPGSRPGRAPVAPLARERFRARSQCRRSGPAGLQFGLQFTPVQRSSRECMHVI